MTDDRTRQGRGAEVAQERRRRSETNLSLRSKLAIPEDIEAKLKAEGRTPRWVNDEGNRIHNLTVRDDYDKVDGVAPVPVGTAEDGSPILAHLLSKPLGFIAEDRDKADERRKDVERAMVKGRVPGSPAAEAAPVPGQMGASTYVDAASSIGRGNQIIE